MGQRAKEKQRALQASDGVRYLLRQYVSALMCEDKDLGLMGQTITPNHFPRDMVLERNVMSLISECVTLEKPPTKQAIQYLAIGRPNMDLSGIENLNFEDSMSREDFISISSHAITNWYKAEMAVAVGAEIGELLQDRSVPLADRYKKAYDALDGIAPMTESTKLIRDGYLHQEAIDSYGESYRLFQSTGFPKEATWFLPSFRHNLGVLNPAETSIIIAQEGVGKSSFAQIQAEWVAHVQGGYDVLYVSLETDLKILGLRSLTRNLKIPSDDWSKFAIDVDSEQFQKLATPFLERRKRAEEGKGYVHYARPYPATPDAIIDAIRRAHTISRAIGRKLLVIIDLLEKIDFPNISNDNAAGVKSAVTTRIGNACIALGVHAIFIGQEGQEGQVFGSTMVRKLTQCMVSLRSKNYKIDGGMGAPTDIPYVVDGTKYLDYLGRQRYWEKKGQSHEHLVTVSVSKNNNSSTGDWRILCERPMGNIFVDTPETIAYLDNMRKNVGKRQGVLGAK